MGSSPHSNILDWFVDSICLDRILGIVVFVEAVETAVVVD